MGQQYIRHVETPVWIRPWESGLARGKEYNTAHVERQTCARPLPFSGIPCPAGHVDPVDPFSRFLTFTPLRLAGTIPPPNLACVDAGRERSGLANVGSDRAVNATSAFAEKDRVEAWRGDWDMRMLWSHLPAQTIRLAQVRLASVTKSVLNPSATTPAMEVADATELAATGVAAYLCGVGPLLGYWIERGQLRAHEEVARLLAEHLQQGRMRAAMLETHLVRLRHDFHGSNIRPIVLKGMVTSRRYFPEPGTRPVSDIDLLIEPHQLPLAKHVLRQAGLIERWQTWKSTTWLMPETSRTVRSLELDHAENPWSVDLHTSIDYRYFRGVWARYGGLPWTSVGLDEVRGCEIQCLTQPLLSAYLAQHASLAINHLRLIRIIELVAVLRRDLAEGTLQWDSLSDLLNRARLWRFVYPALESAERLSPGLLDPKFRRKLVAAATPSSGRVVERAVASGWGGWSGCWLERVEEKLAWFQGPRELAMNVLELALPSGVPLSQVLALQARRVRLLARKAA